MSEEELKNHFDIQLENNIKLLLNCQQELGLSSCMGCDKVFECNIRRAYVDSAYNSMSKGQSGGFDF